MSYLDDYNDNVGRKKIPYDDIPITRNNVQKKSFKESVSGFRVLVSLVAILFVANIVLCGMMFYYIKNGKVKEINVYPKEINATEESISTVASNHALKSSICVAAGGFCNSSSTFYTSTSSKGSGVIFSVDEDEKTVYFLTCYHVVENFSDIWIMLSSKLVPTKVELVNYSSHYDIAVLKYKYSETSSDAYLEGCRPIELYDTTYLSLGDKVFAIGNPLSFGFSITGGEISRINTLMTVESNSFKTREIQTDAAINKGNSGGGLFNNEGKFIGLVNSKLSSAEGTAYAIPGNLAVSIAGSIIRNNEKGSVKHGGKASYVDLGAILAHDEDLGVTFEEVVFDGITKYLIRYYVVVDRITGAIAYGKLHADDLIEAVEFSIYQRGEVVKKKVDMINQFIFEDYSFSIVENSEIVFYVKTNGIGDTKMVKVSASAIKVIS